MATSDSEDFESADEDPEIQIDHTALHSTKEQKEPEKSSTTNESNDNRQKKEPDELLRNEIGIGGTFQTSKDPTNDKTDTEASDINNTTVKTIENKAVKSPSVLPSRGGSNINGSDEAVTKDRQPKKCVKREQKPREPKSGGSARKLGTKISQNILCTGLESESEKVKQDFFASEKTCNQVVGDTHDKDERKTVTVSPYKMDNTAQEIEKLTLEESSEHNIAPVLDKLSQSASEKETDSDSSWGGWGNWGMTSLLFTATESVSALTTQVSQGLGTVLEAGIGAPDPEMLAQLEKEEELKLLQEKKQNEANEFSELQREEEQKAVPSGLFGFSHLISGVSSITRLVETTGNKVLTGGLDTLETIGKKTMEVLQEGDPGLKKKRALFSEKIVLSQVLREAKEKAEKEDQEIEDSQAARKAHFETLFDDYQGLVHLEALEMLSKQCDIKLQSILLTSSGTALSQLQQSLQEVKDICQLPDDEDTEEDESDAVDWRKRLDNAVKGLGVPIATEKLNKTWEMAHGWVENCCSNQKSSNNVEVISARDIHQKAIATLAQLTAESVEQFHKAAELLLVKDDRSPTEEAQTLLQVTSVLTSEVSAVATRFSECLNAAAENSMDPVAVNALITSVFLEAANSSSYIQEAFQLLIPVLEVGLTK
ncbi:protein FAM114A2 isoform X2 [Zootermopsis nevadensis]|nr:protein FAM114A2 isoform X2 [Zootermopsis nevadensis]